MTTTIRGRLLGRFSGRLSAEDVSDIVYWCAGLFFLFAVLLPPILLMIIGLIAGTTPTEAQGGVLGVANGYPAFNPQAWLMWVPAAAMLFLSVWTIPLPLQSSSPFGRGALIGASFTMFIVGSVLSLAFVGAPGIDGQAVLASAGFGVAWVLLVLRALAGFFHLVPRSWREATPVKRKRTTPTTATAQGAGKGGALTSESLARNQLLSRWVWGGTVVAAIASVILTSWPIALVAVGLLVWALVRLFQFFAAGNRLVLETFADLVTTRMGKLGPDGPFLLDAMVAVASGGKPSAAMLQERLGLSTATSLVLMKELEQLVFVSAPEGTASRKLEVQPKLIRQIVAHIRARPERVA